MPRILAINNNKEFGHVFHSLKEWGYEVKIVQNPVDCRQCLNAEKFDLVFVRLESDPDLPLNFKLIKEKQSSLSIIGLTTLTKSELEQLLNTQGLSQSDFTAVFYQPLKLEEIIFTIEEIFSEYQEEPVEEEKPLTQKERRQHLVARRRLLEDQRFSDFLSAHSEQKDIL